MGFGPSSESATSEIGANFVTMPKDECWIAWRLSEQFLRQKRQNHLNNVDPDPSHAVLPLTPAL